MIIKKLISFLLFTIFTTIYSERHWDHHIRDFLSGYFGVILGKSFKLENDCMNGNFDKLLDNLDEAFLEENIPEIMTSISEIYDLETTKCPLNEGKNIFNH